MMGLPVNRTILSAFVICGALAGLAGFMFLARFGNITVVAAQGLELQVVAAVVVGGVNMFGGSGTVVGALLGTVLIDLLDQSLIRWLEISEFWRDAILGLLILLAVAADAVLLKRMQLFWARRLQAGNLATHPPADTHLPPAHLPPGGQNHAA
jgi:rhamnose transport system permease protein